MRLHFLVAAPVSLAAGEHVRVLLRPERIRNFPTGQDGPNVVPPQISFVEYYGPTIRYTVQLDGGESVYRSLSTVTEYKKVTDARLRRWPH